MPTCSQAKIITNLETDIHKRNYKFSSQQQNENQQNILNGNFSDVEITKISVLGSESSRVYSQTLQSYAKQASAKHESVYSNPKLNQIRKNKSFNDYSTMKMIQEHQQLFMQGNLARNSRFKPRRISIEEIDLQQQPSSRRHQISFGDCTSRKESVPVNFLYNSSYRTAGRNSISNNQLKINSLRSELNIKMGSDGEDYEENTSTCSDLNNSDKSSISLTENLPKPVLTHRKSIDYTQFLPLRSKRNSIEDSKTERENMRKLNSLSHNNLSGYFSNFPKLALEVETMGNNGQQNDQMNENLTQNQIEEQVNQAENLDARKMSIDHAKRLLALASIRPSKTFHKTMTEQEIEVLKKYYDIIKPKVALTTQISNPASELEKERYESMTPIVYNSAKVNSSSLQNVKNFIDSYKKDIESGLYSIEYDAVNDPKGFLLRSKLDDSVIKFPNDINDTFFALAITTGDKESQRLGEANLFRTVNWNDTSVPSLSSNSVKIPKLSLKANLTARVDNQSNYVPSSPTSSTISFEYIKSLTCLVNSVVDNKLVKQLTNSAVDVSALPGGVNFDIPSFEELGINLTSLLQTSGSGELPPINPNLEYQSSKLKNTAYKKLKEKVTKSKVMWFSSAPERKPMSVIFEYAGVEMGHEVILDEANKYLKGVGHVVSLEFVPRSVHLNSVYVENLWILTLNDMKTKFYTITNGIKVRDETVQAKSYDEFIFTEYEKFIRNEKYKQLIKNHEKAVQSSSQSQRRQSKKSINY